MAKPTNPVKQILTKAMDRRQFLGLMGASALVITGASGIIGGLTKLGGHASKGYGANTYGETAATKTSRKRQLG